MTFTQREEAGQAQVDACGWRGGGCQLHVNIHKKNLEPSDVVLSSSHAKKLAC